MANKPKKGKSKFVGKKKAVKKSNISAPQSLEKINQNLPSTKLKSGPAEKSSGESGYMDFFRNMGSALANYAIGRKGQIGSSKHSAEKGSGLNVESKPKLTASENRINKKLSSVKTAHEAMVNPEASFATKQAIDSKLSNAKKLHEAVGKSVPGFRESRYKTTPLPVIDKPKSKPQSQLIQEKQEAKLAEKVEAHRKQEDTRNLTKMKASAPKLSPIDTAKESEVLNKDLIGRMSKATKEFPGPENEKKQLAAIAMTSKMAKAGKKTRDVVDRERKVNPYSGRSIESSRNKQASNKKFSNFTESDHKFETLLGNHNLSEKDIDKATRKISAPEKREKRIQKTQVARANKLNQGLPANSNELVNPYSGRTKEKSFVKHMEATGKVIPKGSKRYNDKNDPWEDSPAPKPKPQEANKNSGIRVKGNAEKVVRPPSVATKNTKLPANKPQPKAVGPVAAKTQAPQEPRKPGIMSKVGGAIKKVATSPTTTGILKATGAHLAMAAMHGTNYPRVMQQHASQGPREFKPGWHGFTSPVERPKAEEGTDTKGERA